MENKALKAPLTAPSLKSCLFFPQLPEGDESVNASLHDLGVDVLSSHHHQGRGLREGSAAQGDHANHGAEQRHPVAQLVHQQFNPTSDQRRLVGDVTEGWCCLRDAQKRVLTLTVQECREMIRNKSLN